jgi:hypothetical protein
MTRGQTAEGDAARGRWSDRSATGARPYLKSGGSAGSTPAPGHGKAAVAVPVACPIVRYRYTAVNNGTSVGRTAHDLLM